MLIARNIWLRFGFGFRVSCHGTEGCLLIHWWSVRGYVAVVQWSQRVRENGEILKMPHDFFVLLTCCCFRHKSPPNPWNTMMEADGNPQKPWFDQLAPPVQFSVLACGVMVFFGCHNYLQEAMMNVPGFKFGVMLGYLEVLGWAMRLYYLSSTLILSILLISHLSAFSESQYALIWSVNLLPKNEEKWLPFPPILYWQDV